MKRLLLSLLLFYSITAVSFAAEEATTPATPAAAAPAAEAEPDLAQRVADLEAYVNNGKRATADAKVKSMIAGPGPGHNAWQMVSTALVLFMTLPGLALFYGGLVRKKNVLSVLAQCLGCACMITPLWWLRSEEHTSELQSLAYLVCRLLLEKKKEK